MLDVVLGFAEAMEKFSQIIIQNRTHALDQELFTHVESVHQALKLVFLLVRSLFLLALLQVAIRLALTEDKQNVDAGFWIFFPDILEQMHYFFFPNRLNAVFVIFDDALFVKCGLNHSNCWMGTWFRLLLKRRLDIWRLFIPVRHQQLFKD